jgi:hypothetical protein
MAQKKKIIDLSSKSPQEIFDFMGAMLSARMVLHKKGYNLNIKKIRGKINRNTCVDKKG